MQSAFRVTTNIMSANIKYIVPHTSIFISKIHKRNKVNGVGIRCINNTFQCIKISVVKKKVFSLLLKSN